MRATDAIAAVSAALGLVQPEVTDLPGGVANRTFRLRDAHHDLVLKLAGESTAELGAHAASELAMQSLAADRGLGSPVVLADAVRGLIVSRHIAGRIPDAAEMRLPRFAGRVGAWLARLHAADVPTDLPSIELAERANGYLRGLIAARADPFVESLLRELEVRRAGLTQPLRLAACHHDLHHRNFIDDGSALFVVDWEYAGPGDPAADLASFIAYHRLGPGAIDALLHGYGDAGDAIRRRVEALGWIFDCLCYGWNAAASLAGLIIDPDEQAQIAARLVR